MKDLKTLRLAKGYSQDKLAELAGTSQPHIGRLEKQPGEKEYRPMTVRMAQKLAPLLGCKAKDLLPLSDDVEELPKKPDKINTKVTETDYPPTGRGEQPTQEGKKVTDDDAVLAVIGRLTVENEALKARLRQVEGVKSDTGPRKARGK